MDISDISTRGKRIYSICTIAVQKRLGSDLPNDTQTPIMLLDVAVLFVLRLLICKVLSGPAQRLVNGVMNIPRHG